MDYLHNVIKNLLSQWILTTGEAFHSMDWCIMLNQTMKGFLKKAKHFFLPFFPDMTSVISRKGLIAKKEQNKDMSPFIKSVFGWISKQKRGIHGGRKREEMQFRN